MSRVNRYEYQDWKGFGSRTKIGRKQIGVSKEKFSEMINRSENYVAELEKGNTSCSIHTLYQISKALKMSSDSLLFGEEKNMNNNDEYSNKEILLNIIDRCDEEELAVLKDLIVATYPNLNIIMKKRKGK
ncbi:MAG: helix-turn-helix transcriptional regulator [Clostridia bacterium]|nr:helix-turn-helix transcriptional regulator [Clostridia bacterium]